MMAKNLHDQFLESDIAEVKECLDDVFKYYYPEDWKDRIEEELSEMRFLAFSLYGVLLAKKSDLSRIDPEFAEHVDEQIKKETFCDGRRILLRAWRVLQPADRNNPDPDIRDVVSAVRRILTQMNQAEVDCAI